MTRHRKDKDLTRLREKLLLVAARGERGAPLVFAGREALITDILRAASVPPSEGTAGSTFVIEGPPGAGKTALVGEVAKQLRDRRGTPIICTEIPNGARVEGIWQELGTALAGASPDEMRTTRHSETRSGVGVGGWRVGHTRGRTVAPKSISNPEDVLALRGEVPFGDSTAVVFLDEVQNIEPGTAASELARTLHTQAAIPVLLVCAGLSTGVERLAGAGISRLDEGKIVTLGRLAGDETLDCAHRALAMSREWGVYAPESAVARWAEAIADSSDDWPRHLQCYLNAAWRTLAEQETPNLDTADLDGALAQGDELRRRYYNSRLEVSQVPIEVASVLHGRLKDSGVPMGQLAAAAAVENAIEAMPDETARQIVRSRFERPGDCFNALLRAGLVSLDRGRGRVVSPIPSMTQHILDECEARRA